MQIAPPYATPSVNPPPPASKPDATASAWPVALLGVPFDPLTLELDRDVRAISPNAWFSLGRHGVGLHYARATSVISSVTVLASEVACSIMMVSLP